MEDTAKETAVLKSANMSLGINLLMRLLQGDAAKVLSPAGYDIEIVEKHHNKKVDAPSGTALCSLANCRSMRHRIMKYAYCYDRSQEESQKREQEDRNFRCKGRNDCGEHEVLFAGEDLRKLIEFKHTAPFQGSLCERGVGSSENYSSAENMI